MSSNKSTLTRGFEVRPHLLHQADSLIARCEKLLEKNERKEHGFLLRPAGLFRAGCCWNAIAWFDHVS
jgi:hypothetical protein